MSTEQCCHLLKKKWKHFLILKQFQVFEIAWLKVLRVPLSFPIQVHISDRISCGCEGDELCFETELTA